MSYEMGIVIWMVMFGVFITVGPYLMVKFLSKYGYKEED